MIIINKKRILLIIFALVMSISISQISGNNIENSNNYMDSIENTKMVNAVPVSNKVIVIDAGHGTPDGGAVGGNGTVESEINLKIALKLQKLLEESGATVVLTRSDENGIYDNEEDSIGKKKVSDIKNRVKIGNESTADIFVSIHLNKLEQTQYDGWQTFYKKDSEDGKKLAECIQGALNENIEKENNRIAKSIDNVYIIKNVEIPTTIVECGFLSNYEEEKNLKDDKYQDRLAYGVYIGIMNYFYR